MSKHFRAVPEKNVYRQQKSCPGERSTGPYSGRQSSTRGLKENTPIT
jgi:hypothetical protein